MLKKSNSAGDDTLPNNFNELFEADLAFALSVPQDHVKVVSVTSMRELDVSVVFDVELEDSGYDTSDDLSLEMEDQLSDPDSTLMQGNVTQYIQPDSFEVETVYIDTSSSSVSSWVISSAEYSSSSSSQPVSSVGLSYSSLQSSSSFLQSSSSFDVVESSSTPVEISGGVLSVPALLAVGALLCCVIVIF